METVSETTVYLDLQRGHYDDVVYRDCEIVLVGVPETYGIPHVAGLLNRSGAVRNCTFENCLFVGEGVWVLFAQRAASVIEAFRA